MKQTIETSTHLKFIFHFWEDDLKKEHLSRKFPLHEIFILQSKKNYILMIYNEYKPTKRQSQTGNE